MVSSRSPDFAEFSDPLKSAQGPPNCTKRLRMQRGDDENLA
jgi:hypothetical protein